MNKVILIDDEEVIREGMKKIINWRELDCKIVGEAEDGNEGIEMIKKLQPDVILTDIRMPGIDGLELISKIKNLDISCKVVILTGFRNFEYAQEAVKHGVFRLLLKPTKTSEIYTAVKDALNELKSERAKKEELKNLQEKFFASDVKTLDFAKSETVKEPDAAKPKYLINKALAYINSNYMKDVNLKSIADELYISTWYLSKLLKKETGNNFIEILNKIRIEEAKRLLSEPKYKIYNIAAEIGFTDVPYFIRLFKKHTGMTPIEFRNKTY